MHEFDVVKSLIDALLPELEGKGVRKVKEVRFRRGSTFSEDALMQAFESLSQGTVLEGAKVEIEVLEKSIRCRCGHHQVVTSDDLIGHIFVCPLCGQTQEIDEAHDLEMLEVIAEI
ncbi:MAG: hydrogenase/urease maturation nickel metallochaperone HypA [Armatimonadetes bacterium]|nr:hydrogenase/urease maturation nickel metallochaperone HypA [Armatimonadota bacterium]MDW8029517.1 hydrogenase maturation nickel metallochaperone HypA [Armatimonadota bacterium]